ncbi:MAG: T9SS type A sorting domain-containing protein [Ignavibacteriales bacterium]|nr:T9SS type A sorting domain-containing protein [Ignavibacteriaceae bacterium]NLH61738.1 T9SS type A sorting domain-containing protein [Ignavibacteriales bacterium]HOJ19691.1 T9SS type A sorting domain-containing protein [Ignavibacteriaceae bacterium]HPO56571.1 T9SS type A sorting domain-containing protein [Ignavibacteriaceae bacterium]
MRFSVIDVCTVDDIRGISAGADDGSVVLQWSTATETNNRGFSVQKKTTGEWISIGFVNGTGTSTKMNSYTFTDNGYSSGKTYYRLKQIDFDGTFAYSNEVEVENLKPLTFGLSQNYPNPFNPSTVINYQIPEKGNVSLKLFDILGNEVATLVSAEQEAGSYNHTFNASGLASGTYIYKLSSGENVSVRKMTFIK